MMKHKIIQQLRDNLKKVLKRARPKQLKKLQKAYHGKRLKKWWSNYANVDGCSAIAELKDFEGVGHRIKGGHRHNHIFNVCHRIIFRSKSARHLKPNDRKELMRTFYENLWMNPEVISKILATRNKLRKRQ